jgi:recombination protein U
MTNWKTRGHRGDALEDLIILTNEYYKNGGYGRIDKVNTPIKVIEIDSKGTVTKAFFEKKSTVDFIGIVQGVFIAFDAKETNLNSLPLQNIHEHQIEYMKDVDKNGGYAFIIIHFKKQDEYYLVPFELINHYFQSDNTRKSIPYKDMDKRFKIIRENNGVLNFLNTLNEYSRFKKEY